MSFWEDENFDPFEETLSDLSHEEYSFWAKCDLWTLEEAAYIVNGNTPRNQDWFDEQAQAAASEQVARGEPPLDEPVFVPTDSHGNPVGQCYHLSLKAAETKKLRVTESGVAPQDYVDWIRSKGFGIPDGLQEKLEEYQSETLAAHQSLRASQHHKERCRAIAALLWKKDRNRTIADLILSDEIAIHGCENNTYAETTLRNWVKDLAPNRKPGRRPNKPPASK